MALVYTEGTYSFVNTKDQTTFTPSFLFRSKNEIDSEGIKSSLILRDLVSQSSIISQIKSKGGYIIALKTNYGIDSDGNFTHNGEALSAIDVESVTDQYSVKGNGNALDIYIMRTFAACVFNNTGYSTITVDPGITDVQCSVCPLYKPSILMLDHWLFSTFNELSGKPASSYAFLPTGVVQNSAFDEFCGISADYYCFESGQLIALYNPSPSRVPFLYYPKNRAAAYGVARIFNKKVSYNEKTVVETYPFEPDGTFGIIFNEGQVKRSRKLKKLFQEGFRDCGKMVNSFETEFYKYPTPISSGKKIVADLVYLYTSIEQMRGQGGVTVDGFYYECPGCDYSRIDSDVLLAIQGLEPKSEDGVFANSAINEVLSNSISIYEKTKVKAYQSACDLLYSKFNEFNDAFLSNKEKLEVGVFGDFLDTTLDKESFANLGTRVDNESMSLTTEGGVVFCNTIPVNLPVVKEKEFADISEAKDGLFEVLSKIGADATFVPITSATPGFEDFDIPDGVEIPQVGFGIKSENAYVSCFKTALADRLTSVCGALRNVFDIFINNKLHVDNNVQVVQWKGFLVKSKKYKYEIRPQDTPLGIENVSLKNLSITLEPKTSTIKMKLYIRGSENKSIHYAHDDTAVAKSLMKQVQQMVSNSVVGCNVSMDYLGSIGRVVGKHYQQKGLCWDIPSNRFSMPCVNCNHGGYSASSKNPDFQGFDLTIQIKHSTGVSSIDYNAPCDDSAAFVNQFDNSASKLATIPMLQYLLDNVETLQSMFEQKAVVKADTTFITAILGRKFFDMGWSNFDVMDAALEYIKQANPRFGYIEDEKAALEKLEKVVRQMQKDLQVESFTPESTCYYLTKSDALNTSKGVIDFNYAPLTMLLTADQSETEGD